MNGRVTHPNMSPLYRPSNGTEGECFMADFCDNCTKNKSCGILASTMFYDIDDIEYPPQWRIIDGKPTCLAFKDKNEPEPFRHHVEPAPGQKELF